MKAQETTAEMSQLLRQFSRTFTKWLAYLAGLLTASSVIGCVYILPMYSSQRELFSRLSSLAGFTAFAIASSLGVIFWCEKFLPLKDGTSVQPRSFLLKAGLTSLAAGLAAVPLYLLTFDASVKIQTALQLCAQSSPSSEFARDTLVSLTGSSFIFQKVRIANEFMTQWGPVAPGVAHDVVASSNDVPYGHALIGLNVLMVAGVQSGLFLLAMCNFFVVSGQGIRPWLGRAPRPS